MSASNLDDVASAELKGMQQRVAEFQRQAQAQAALQEEITKINELCFHTVREQEAQTVQQRN